MEKEFEIVGSDGRLFCKGKISGQNIILKTSNSSITLDDLAKQVTNPRYMRGNLKKRRAHR